MLELFPAFSHTLAVFVIDDAVIIGIAVAMAAASAAGAAVQQSQAKKAAAAQNAQMKEAQMKSVAVNRAQGEITAAEKRRQIQNRYDAYKGAMKASAAERNLGAGSRTSLAMSNALGVQAIRESSKVSLEAALNQQSFGISSTPLWQTSQSSGLMTGLSGLQGGLSGLQLGLSIQSSQASRAASQAQLGALQSTPASAMGSITPPP